MCLFMLFQTYYFIHKFEFVPLIGPLESQLIPHYLPEKKAEILILFLQARNFTLPSTLQMKNYIAHYVYAKYILQ